MFWGNKEVITYLVITVRREGKPPCHDARSSRLRVPSPSNIPVPPAPRPTEPGGLQPESDPRFKLEKGVGAHYPPSPTNSTHGRPRAARRWVAKPSTRTGKPLKVPRHARTRPELGM
eukprot:760544-Hanusia_phi.AAC.3